MKKKSILLIGWFFYPKLGGVESIMLSQARYFLNQKYEVSVLTSKISGLPDNDQFSGIKIYRRDFINSDKEFSESLIKNEFGKILSEVKPSLVHFHNGSYPVASLDMNAGAQNIKSMFEEAKKKNIAVIDHAHNAQLKNPDITKQLRDLSWDYLICVSQFVKENWQKLGTNAKKIKVVYNGIEFNDYQNVQPNKTMVGLKKDNEKIIFFPSRVMSMSQKTLSKQKNFELLLDAGKLLLKKNVSNFRIVAVLDDAENYDVELDALNAAPDLKNKITFIPSVLPQDMPGYYAASDIVCVPSVDETFGLVYLEAMAAGKVAIASNTGGPQEYIEDGRNGLLVSPNNAQDLADKLALLLQEENLINKIGAEAKQTAQGTSLEKMMEEIEKIYEELI